MKQLLALAIAVSFATNFANSAVAQTLTVAEVLQQEKNWDEWIRQKKHIHITGRYAGRFSKQFRLEKLPIMFQPGRNTVLPADLEGGQRMTVSGYLGKTGSRYEIDVDRISVGSTDADRIRERIRRLPVDQPDQAFALADEYESKAKFYGDEELAAEIKKLRTDAFAVQRKLVVNDAAALQALVATGTKLGVAKDTLDAITFQAIVVMSKQPAADSQKLILEIRKLAGWDKPSPFLDSRAEAEFLADPVGKYESADGPNRQRMNRRFYLTIRLPQILSARKPDGSNGDTIAQTIKTELPEVPEEAKKQENAYIEFQISKVSSLTRKQLQDLDNLLRDFGRQNETEAAVEKWLQAQQQRLDNGQLDGTIAIADEYLFAFDVWKNPGHKSQASDLLKKAFMATQGTAPKVAAEIEARLKSLDWIRLHDRWMTTTEASQLPDNDTQKAMIEGRVVAGMTANKVVELLGEPSRKVRIVSSKGIHVIWIFGQQGMSATVVHLSRTRFQTPDDALVTYVAVDRR